MMTQLTHILAALVTVEFLESGLLATVLSKYESDSFDSSSTYAETDSFSSKDESNGCIIRINGDLGQPQPVYLHNNNYPVPRGTTGTIHLNTGETITIACTGPRRVIRHPNKIVGAVATATATCVQNNSVSGAGWLNGNGQFGHLTCSTHSLHHAQRTNKRCFNNNLIIRIGYVVNKIFYPKFWSCFDENRLEVLYARYEQNPSNAVHQTRVSRPAWLAGSFYPRVPVNMLYTIVRQKITIARLVGKKLADKYITHTQFLSRGHLAAKTDFIYATGQRATYYFINAAPQWQLFNAGNWNWLEQNLRARIGLAGYNAIIYTGTFGVSQLRDQNNRLVDIYLHRDANNNPQIPVPLYFYKVVFDAGRRIGTAFVSINNPYYTEAEVRALTFCTDRCRNNNKFSWLRWQPDRIDIGYSFCCTVNDFRRTVPHLPNFTVNDILT